MNIYLSVPTTICLILAVSFAVAQDYPIPKSIEYLDNGFSFDVHAAIEHDNEILVAGRDRYYRFELKTQKFRFPMPHEFNGYIADMATLPDGNIVAAGHNSDRIFGFKDRRQNIIAIADPLKVSPINPSERTIGVVDSKTLSDRLSRGLHVDEDGKILLLSQNNSGNKIIEFDSNLRKVRTSESFGVDADVDMVATGDGNYIVIGFFSPENEHGQYPAYWIVNRDLVVLEEHRLGYETYYMVGTSIAQAVVASDGVYLAYGWDKDGPHSELLNEVQVVKLDASNEKIVWKADLPFNTEMEIFITGYGIPYAIYPREEELELVFFNPNNGEKLVRTYARPLEPDICFSKFRWYGVDDVVDASDGHQYIIFSRYRSDYRQGCVSIARFVY